MQIDPKIVEAARCPGEAWFEPHDIANATARARRARNRATSSAIGARPG
jgi:hypothetical protein